MLNSADSLSFMRMEKELYGTVEEINLSCSSISSCFSVYYGQGDTALLSSWSMNG
jgi:hypothetical protein